MVDDGSIAPGAASCLARLEEIGDPQYEALRTANEVWASMSCTKNWAHLKDTFDIMDWLPLLVAVGADTGNVQSLAMLAQQGVAGRVEANRLLWTWCHPQASHKKPYRERPQVFQGSIRRARQSLDEPPNVSQDWKSWVPGRALGPWWEPHRDLIPTWAEGKQWVGGAAPEVVSKEEHKSLVDKAVADARAGMLTMAEVEEEKKKAVQEAMATLDVKEVLNHWRPMYLLASQHENGTWSMGWWFDERGASEWVW